jgi:isopentenyldiphosphate isomerase
MYSFLRSNVNKTISRYSLKVYLCIIYRLKMQITEYFPIVDQTGNVIGRSTREECHSGSFLLHPVVHLHVFNTAGELYLQKRAMSKDIQPGKWDTSVGGHVDYGEEIPDALRREVREELGITCFEPVFIFKYPFRSNREYELVHTYYTTYNGKIIPDPIEISEGRFWKKSEIEENIGKDVFTPNFEQEIKQLMNLM